MGRIVPLLFALAALLLYTHNETVCSGYHLDEAVRKTPHKFRHSGGGVDGVDDASMTNRVNAASTTYKVNSASTNNWVNSASTNNWVNSASTNNWVNSGSTASKGNSLIEAKTKNKQDYFSLKLNEQNFRWSVPLLMGSKKKSLQFGVVTSTPITALYCSYNANQSDEMKDLKYEVDESEGVKYVGCKSRHCTAVGNGKSCAPIENLLQMVHDLGLRKKTCTKRFCNYVNDINFLNVNTKLDKKNMSVCSFSSNINWEHIEGFYFRDSFYLYDKVKFDYNHFGCITKSDDLTFNNTISGFIGLAYNRTDATDHSKESPSILHTLVQKSLSKKNIFGLCFIEGGGFASFGGANYEALKKKVPAVSKLQMGLQHLEADAPIELLADQQATSHEIVWLAYSGTSKNTYNLLLKEVNMVSGTKPLASENGGVAVVDSYSYFLSFPADIAAKLKTAVHTSCVGEGNTCSDIINKGVFTLKNQGVANFPTIELVFHDGKVLIQPKDYLIHEGLP
ncbi:hypothetical protein PCYB_146010 [Plasmodium cynomolgi strain B]|uniref:Peptidase A1 domain-containing protein n=1 Tax=Plasmodium cynomolgi (strain B) TaxID=1120755 RepID=K6VIH1_PLACD|nr:hypothetical protein PCYB_146010 [Plasmodium cynomolgi strain B]GAB69172.1 hypothetical protein PCYB_146010 [Plasmodium cynomolgi strain B]